MTRADDLVRFYDLLGVLEQKLGGKRTLATCSGRQDWPTRGVYFFFEQSESRSDSGMGPRVVRVGTHALKSGSATTLWKRLSQHRGTARSGGGNHRGSIFRSLVGESLSRRDYSEALPSWGRGADPAAAAAKIGVTAKEVRAGEYAHEVAVSRHICAMPVLWLVIDDAAGPESRRGYVERQSIALLSNFDRDELDRPSSRWLGQYSTRTRVRQSGLWNNNHVDERYENEFLNEFETMVRR